jgi:hypothetical protein
LLRKRLMPLQAPTRITHRNPKRIRHEVGYYRISFSMFPSIRSGAIGINFS